MEPCTGSCHGGPARVETRDTIKMEGRTDLIRSSELPLTRTLTIGNIRVHALEAGLQRLSPDHREVLLLRQVHAMDYEEIAAVQDCAVGTVKSRISRAREALREAMEGFWP